MESFVFKAKIIPNAKQFQVSGFYPPCELKIRVCEKPIKGKVNLEIERELSKKLKSRVKIIKGIHSRNKTIQIGLTEQTALERIQAITSN
ncbi:DUF167 domain-containing protein [Candidatus Micrarchaeota archaeon]|nr:DUF167 domain-containing protein [Candidatus Micrarchaeota archaeon]MBU1929999.1 DUF167 domain-containing protein [Candidatus Micrarchaeota archaeon]